MKKTLLVSAALLLGAAATAHAVPITVEFNYRMYSNPYNHPYIQDNEGTGYVTFDDLDYSRPYSNNTLNADLGNPYSITWSTSFTRQYGYDTTDINGEDNFDVHGEAIRGESNMFAQLAPHNGTPYGRAYINSGFIHPSDFESVSKIYWTYTVGIHDSWDTLWDNTIDFDTVDTSDPDFPLLFWSTMFPTGDYIHFYEGLCSWRYLNAYGGATDYVNAQWSGVGRITSVYEGTPNVTPVPEPATALLFGTGLIGLSWIQRRRHV